MSCSVTLHFKNHLGLHSYLQFVSRVLMAVNWSNHRCILGTAFLWPCCLLDSVICKWWQIANYLQFLLLVVTIQVDFCHNFSFSLSSTRSPTKSLGNTGSKSDSVERKSAASLNRSAANDSVRPGRTGPESLRTTVPRVSKDEDSPKAVPGIIMQFMFLCWLARLLFFGVLAFVVNL